MCRGVREEETGKKKEKGVLPAYELGREKEKDL